MGARGRYSLLENASAWVMDFDPEAIHRGELRACSI